MEHEQRAELEARQNESTEMDAGYRGKEMGRGGVGIRRKPVGGPAPGGEAG